MSVPSGIGQDDVCFITSVNLSTGEITIQYHDKGTRETPVQLKNRTYAQELLNGIPERTYKDGDVTISDEKIYYHNIESIVLGFETQENGL
jgi:hypothetical protein